MYRVNFDKNLENTRLKNKPLVARTTLTKRVILESRRTATSGNILSFPPAPRQPWLWPPSCRPCCPDADWFILKKSDCFVSLAKFTTSNVFFLSELNFWSLPCLSMTILDIWIRIFWFSWFRPLPQPDERCPWSCHAWLIFWIRSHY